MPAGPEPMTATRLPEAGLTSNGSGALCRRGLRLEDLVAGVAVAVADGDGLLDLVTAAVLLARRRADAAQHRRERDGALEDARRLDEVALGVGLQEPRDVDVAGALVLAGRQAVGVVVAEDELEVGLADLAQARRLRAHDHLRLRRARAGDGWRVLALHLDDAHAAGAEAGQLGLVAECGHLDAVVAADLQDGLALAPRQRATVDLDGEGGRDEAPLRRLRREQALGALVGWGWRVCGSVSVIVSRETGAALGRSRGASRCAHRSRHRAMGWQTPAGQRPSTMWASNSGAKYRIPEIAAG